VIGFAPDFPSDNQKFGPIEALSNSIRRNYESLAMTFTVIGRIFTRQADIRSTLSGPIEIARISGQFARISPALLIGLIGMISLQLGVFNLLPIPILDGGVIALLFIEGLIRRDLSFNLKEKILLVGFFFLIILMGFVVFNDLSKIIHF
jgi:regulator of sigma E protease